jgi:hypothetical protein
LRCTGQHFSVRLSRLSTQQAVSTAGNPCQTDAEVRLVVTHFDRLLDRYRCALLHENFETALGMRHVEIALVLQPRLGQFVGHLVGRLDHGDDCRGDDCDGNYQGKGGGTPRLIELNCGLGDADDRAWLRIELAEAMKRGGELF